MTTSWDFLKATKASFNQGVAVTADAVPNAQPTCKASRNVEQLFKDIKSMGSGSTLENFSIHAMIGAHTVILSALRCYQSAYSVPICSKLLSEHIWCSCLLWATIGAHMAFLSALSCYWSTYSVFVYSEPLSCLLFVTCSIASSLKIFGSQVFEQSSKVDWRGIVCWTVS